MLSENFRDTPFWWQEAPPEDASSAPVPEEVDVAIVGSGYTGLCCALELAGEGVRVAVLDAGPLGGGGSSRSGGMVTGGQKLVVTDAIAGLSAERQAHLLEDAHESLVTLEERIARYGLDADYERYGRLILAHVPKHYRRLERWEVLLRERAGSTVSLLPRERQGKEIGGSRYHGALLIEDYGGLHPGKYHRALREAVRTRGAALVSHAPVLGIARDGAGFMLRTGRGDLRAREVVIGTNGYSDSLIPGLRRGIVPVHAYVIATAPMPSGMAERIVPRRRMMSDTQRDLFWMRLSPDGTRMIFGARPGVFEQGPRQAALQLHRMMCSVWPELHDVPVDHCWTGLIGMTADYLPHMGTHDGVHYALGCNGSGVAMMSYLGTQTARKLLGQQNRPCAFEGSELPKIPALVRGPWLVPVAAGWYRLRDRMDEFFA
jgi:glycine/D-amino acid oxidase-like deaminating enzyme